jgi:hypothetical protein
MTNTWLADIQNLLDHPKGQGMIRDCLVLDEAP